MQNLEVIVDFNGIVLFDPQLLEEFCGGIEPDQNLYRRFTTTGDGDRVVEQGVIVPILSINDSIYKVQVRFAHERSQIPSDLIVLSNAEFPLRIATRAIVADLATLLEWAPEENWHALDLPAGNYAVAINGFRSIQNNEVVDFGYEIVVKQCATLPKVSGSLTTNMQVNELPCLDPLVDSAGQDAHDDDR